MPRQEAALILQNVLAGFHKQQIHHLRDQSPPASWTTPSSHRKSMVPQGGQLRGGPDEPAT